VRRRISSGWELEQIQRHLDQLLDLLAMPREPGTGGWTPAVDLLEHQERYLVRVDLPGVAAGEIVVTLREQELRIAGRKLPNPERTQRRRCHQMERGFGSFAVEVMLPGPVRPAETRAHLRGGVLEIALPRLPERRHSTYTITVSDEDP
jgi:HSP20 family protein